MKAKRKIVVELSPPGSRYVDLLPGALYRVLRGTAPKSDRDHIWIKAPSPSDKDAGGRDGDFYVRKGILSGQYSGNRPKDDELVEFLGLLSFDVEDEQ